MQGELSVLSTEDPEWLLLSVFPTGESGFSSEIRNRRSESSLKLEGARSLGYNRTEHFPEHFGYRFQAFVVQVIPEPQVQNHFMHWGIGIRTPRRGGGARGGPFPFWIHRREAFYRIRS